MKTIKELQCEMLKDLKRINLEFVDEFRSTEQGGEILCGRHVNLRSEIVITPEDPCIKKAEEILKKYFCPSIRFWEHDAHEITFVF